MDVKGEVKLLLKFIKKIGGGGRVGPGRGGGSQGDVNREVKLLWKFKKKIFFGGGGSVGVGWGGGQGGSERRSEVFVKSFFLGGGGGGVRGDVNREVKLLLKFKINSNSLANLRKTTIYYTKVDLVNDNVYTKFGLNQSIRFQDIEQKLNSDVNQGQ